MEHRSRGRKPDPRGGKKFSRRSPPPEGTGLEAVWLEANRDAERPLHLHMRDGRTIRGTLEAYDRSSVFVRGADGVSQVLRKSEIRFFLEPD